MGRVSARFLLEMGVRIEVLIPAWEVPGEPKSGLEGASDGKGKRPSSKLERPVLWFSGL